MDRRIGMRTTAASLRRFFITFILLVFVGRTLNAFAQTLTILYSFNGGDGENPSAVMVQGSDGNFYGTTAYGGTDGNGTVFRISPTGSLTNLHSFAGHPGDGQRPDAGLVQSRDGNFYGTTFYGGTNDAGTVFRINPKGSSAILYSFRGHPEGAFPTAGLVQGRDGGFYGTTEHGGATEFDGENGNGTVFRVGPSADYTNLYSFGGLPDGAGPFAGLVLGADGKFYGTTSSGGVNADGTVFRISPNGSLTNLHSFAGSSNNGMGPLAGLIQGRDGNFYGTTEYSGKRSNNFYYGYGTVFRISPSGSLAVLHRFGGPDGASPEAGLLQGSDGNFYGTTREGGTCTNCPIGCGTVFQMTPDGNLSNIHSFTGSPEDGAYPQAGLVQASNGDLYGTTYKGGMNNKGTVFRLTIPLNPPPKPIN